jgi:hypothetical protein
MLLLIIFDFDFRFRFFFLLDKIFFHLFNSKKNMQKEIEKKKSQIQSVIIGEKEEYCFG